MNWQRWQRSISSIRHEGGRGGFGDDDIFVVPRAESRNSRRGGAGRTAGAARRPATVTRRSLAIAARW